LCHPRVMEALPRRLTAVLLTALILAGCQLFGETPAGHGDPPPTNATCTTTLTDPNGDPNPVCAASMGSCPEGSSASPAGSAPGIRIVAERQADLHLFVSNQSFDDASVELTVSIDGTELVSGPFDVEGQHNWCQFPAKISPGRHVVTVVSDTGAELRERFALPETGRRYAVIDYWYGAAKDRPHFTWQFLSEPPMFG